MAQISIKKCARISSDSAYDERTRVRASKSHKARNFAQCHGVLYICPQAQRPESASDVLKGPDRRIIGRRVKQNWEVYPNDEESESEGIDGTMKESSSAAEIEFESVEMDGTIKEYDPATDTYSVFYDQDGTTVSEGIPPRSVESELRLIDGSGVYEEKVNELLATGNEDLALCFW